MPDILVRNLSVETVERLKERARKHRRSLQAEVATVIEEAVEGDVDPWGDFLGWAAAFKAGIDPAIQTDSTELIRKDRDSDYGRDL